jgi:cell division protein FtsA
MSRKIDNNLMVALDIGTSKVVAIVAEVLPDNKLDIIGFGSHPSKGMKKGIVVNLDAITQSIERAIEEAELMAGCQIHNVYTGIAGNHIKSLNSHGIVAIRDREIATTDVDRVIDAAKAVAIPTDQKVLHVLPQEFIIDHQRGIHDPIGMTGIRLEANVHIVTGGISAAQNIVNCIRRCGLEVEDVILEQLASSYAVLMEDEKQLGVCLVDIGGGTTDIAVFIDGTIRHTAVLPIAGDQVTNDIAIALRTPTQNAENIKLQHGCTCIDLADPEYIIDVAHIGGFGTSQINQLDLAEIIEPRYDELFILIRNELRKVGLENSLGSGIVLTGGSSKIQGVMELAARKFELPVRIGVPMHITGLNDTLKNPIFATGIGLLLYGLQHQQRSETEIVVEPKGVKEFLVRVKSWFQGNF